jgi:hypothetical protein
MEAVAVRLAEGERWTYLVGPGASKDPLDLVVRAFDADVLVAIGDAERGPDGEPLRVPAGQGRRLCGWHFFARPADAARPARVTYRGA